MKKFYLCFLMIGVMLGGSLSTARAVTWYLQANQTVDWNTLSIWWSQPIGGGTNPTSISLSDDFDLNGYNIVTPKASSGTTTFGGKQLLLHGGLGGYISTKTEPTATVAIPNITSYGGFIQDNAYTGILPITISTWANEANTTISGCQSGRGLNFSIGTLNKFGDICAIGNGGGSAGGAILMSVNSMTAFTGTLYIADGCQFTFENGVTSGGALDIEGAGTAVTSNYTVTFKGLTVNGTVKAAGTYSASSLGWSGTGQVVVQAATPVTIKPTSMFGVNLPGGSFDSGAQYPTDPAEWTYYQGKKLNLVRVAFTWERLEPTLNGPLNTTALASLDSAVALASARGMTVLLDMHNYDRYNISGTSYLVGTTQVPYSAYQYAWKLLAAHFASESGVYGYDIMNEPNGTGGTWATAAQYGVNGVRQGDTTHYVIVEGDSYAGAQSWMTVNAGLSVTDSASKLLYSAHTYWDSNNSGVYSGSYDSNNDYPNVGQDRVAQFIYWLGLKGAKGLVGEFGVPNNVSSPDYRWNIALNKFLYLLNSSGVEGTYWSGGECWGTDYTLSCATGKPPVDAPAMAVLSLYGGG